MERGQGQGSSQAPLLGSLCFLHGSVGLTCVAGTPLPLRTQLGSGRFYSSLCFSVPASRVLVSPCLPKDSPVTWKWSSLKSDALWTSLVTCFLLHLPCLRPVAGSSHSEALLLLGVSVADNI